MRPAFFGPHAAVAVFVAGVHTWACGSSSGSVCGPGTAPRGEVCEAVPARPAKSPRCGPGTHVENGQCIASEPTRDGGTDSSAPPKPTSDASSDGPPESTVNTEPDQTPPVFEGARSAAAVSDSTIRVTWDPATDDRTITSDLVYHVFVGTAAGAENYSTPAIVSAPGATTAFVGGLERAPTKYFFVVRAHDGAGNEDENVQEVSAQLGYAPTSPVFSGCATAVEAGESEVTVTWLPATDDVTPQDQIEYRIWVGDTADAARANTGRPSKVVTGGLETTISGLARGKRYFFYCQAVDAEKNPDQNQQTVDLLLDRPPRWVLYVTASDIQTTSVTLTWPQASDDVTPASDIVYLVHAEGGSTPVDMETAPGALTATLSGLQSQTQYTVTAHARDGSGQLDAPGATTVFVTLISYSVDIQSRFTSECATSGCHDATAAGGLVLTAGQSYGALVGVMAKGPSPPGWPFVDTAYPYNSYLYVKVSGQSGVGVIGAPMPPEPDGGSSRVDYALAQMVLDWQFQGAPNN